MWNVAQQALQGWDGWLQGNRGRAIQPALPMRPYMQPIQPRFGDFAPQPGEDVYAREHMLQQPPTGWRMMRDRHLQPVGQVMDIADEGGAISPQVQRGSAINPIQGGSPSHQRIAPPIQNRNASPMSSPMFGVDQDN
jgi:hypothetical protein